MAPAVTTAPTSAASTARKPTAQTQQLPPPNSDFYELAETLDRRGAGAREDRCARSWRPRSRPSSRSTGSKMPFRSSCCRRSRQLGIGGLGMQGYGCRGGSPLLFGFVAMEMARVDASIATFFGVHNGLAMGSIYLGGSEEQKQKWLPPMARLEKIGCFGLTEPLVGSGASGGLTDDGEARGRHLGPQRPEEVDRQFALVRPLDHLGARRRRQPGQGLHRREQDDARLQRREDREQDRAQGGPERPDHAEGLPGARREPPPGRQLVPRHRAGAAHDALRGGWEATGCAMGAYENALKYAQERLQFGKPIGSFQLVQDLLAKMLANITACQCLMVRMAQLHDEGKLTDAHAALAKAFCTAKCARDGRVGARAARRQRHRRRLQRRRASSPTPRRSTPTKARSRCRT